MIATAAKRSPQPAGPPYAGLSLLICRLRELVDLLPDLVPPSEDGEAWLEFDSAAVGLYTSLLTLESIELNHQGRSVPVNSA